MLVTPLDAAATASAWADWIQAVFAVAALVAAGFAWHESHKLNDREAERDKRHQEDRLREAQAARINAWPVWLQPTVDEPIWTIGVKIANTSEVPMYGGTLYVGWASRTNRGGFVGTDIYVELVPPGESIEIPLPTFMYQYAVNSGAFKPEQLTSDEWPPSRVPPIVAVLQFQDVLGAYWARDVHGSLVLVVEPSGRMVIGTDAVHPLEFWDIIPPPPAPVDRTQP